jgi:hypothetical protein
MVFTGGEFPVFLFYIGALSQNSNALAVYVSFTEF